MPKARDVLSKVCDLCKRRDIVVERCIGSRSGKTRADTVLDYGPLGVELKRNLAREWWHEIVTSRDNVFGVELSLSFLQHFTHNDRNNRFAYLEHAHNYARRMMDSQALELPMGLAQNLRTSNVDAEDAKEFIFRYIRSAFSGSRKGFSLEKLAQFLCYSSKRYLHASRNILENLYRSKEKEFFKLCFFCQPKKVRFWMDYWIRKRLSWAKKYADMPGSFSLEDSPNKKLFCHEENHFLTDTMTVQFEFPWGKEAIECISSYSNIKEEHKRSNHEHCLGVVIATYSIEKGILAYLLDAFYEKDNLNFQDLKTRHNMLRLHPVLAPKKVAVLTSNVFNKNLVHVAQQLAAELRQAGIQSSYIDMLSHSDTLQSYYQQEDEIGTPYCVTVDESTLVNGIVTLRNRDTTLSEYLHISEILKTVLRLF